MTQVFKDSDVKRNALERTFPDWERGQDIPTQAKQQIVEHAGGEPTRTQQQKVVADKQRREQAV